MGFSHRSNQSRHWCLCLLALCWDVSKMLTFLLHWDSMGYYTCNWLVDASHYSTVCRYSVIIHFSGSSWVLIPTSCVRGRGFRATSRINKGQIYLKVPVFPVCSQFKASLLWWLCFRSPGGRFLSQSVGLLPKHERPTRTVPRWFSGAGALHQLVGNWWRKKKDCPLVMTAIAIEHGHL
jgi:hypothetical protein